jgi:hypothetical protein
MLVMALLSPVGDDALSLLSHVGDGAAESC